MLPSRSATCSARAQLRAPRRARRGARPRRTACGRWSMAYVEPTATPRRASSRLRPARVVRLIGAARGAVAAEHGDQRRRRGRGDDAASDRRADGASASGAAPSSDAARLDAARARRGRDGRRRRRARRRRGTPRRPGSPRTAGSGGAAARRRRCIVTTTAVGTSTSPSHGAERNEPIARPASRTIRQSWRTPRSTAHGAHVAACAARYSWSVSHVRACAGVSRASAAEAARARGTTAGRCSGP